VVGVVEGDDMVRPIEEGRRCWLRLEHLTPLELALPLGGIVVRATEDHETPRFQRKWGILLVLGIIRRGLRIFLRGTLLAQELLQQPTDLVGMLDGVTVVRAWPFEHLLEVVRSLLRGGLLALGVGGGDERTVALLLVLLLLLPARVVGDTLVPLGLTLGAIKNRSHSILAGRVAGGNVEKLLGGTGALTPLFVDQALGGGP
jgi:hypothetical protein